jgi:ABC-2 type transport system permease protein
MNLIWANFKRISKDPSLLLGIFTFPVLAVILLSILTSGGITNISPISVGISDNDKSKLSEEFINELSANKNFNISVYEDPEGRKAFGEHKIPSLLIIPEGFFEKSLNGQTIQLELVRSSGIPKDVLVGTAEGLIKKILKKEIIASLKDPDKIVKESEYLSLEISVKASQANITLLISIIITLMMFSSIFLAFEINNIRQKKLLFRFYSTPNTPRVLTGSILLSMFFWFCIQAIVLFSLSSYFLKSPLISQNILSAGVLFGSFILFNLSLGVLIAKICKNSSLISAFANLIIVPTGMISGTFVPRELLPIFLEPFSVLAPQYWLMDGIEKINLGRNFLSIMPDILVILLFALCFFSAGIFRFKNLIRS